MSIESAAAEAMPAADEELAPEAEAEAPEALSTADDESDGDELEVELGALWDKMEQPRGKDGKFASRNADGDDEHSAEGEADEDSEAGQPEEKPEGEAEPPLIAAPDTWPAEMQERFKSLPPEVRDFAEFAAQREQAYGDAFTRVGQSVYETEHRLMEIEPVEKVLAPFADEIARRGVSKAQAVYSLLQAQRMLDTNPIGGTMQILQSYGFNPAQVAQAIVAHAQQQPNAPQYQQPQQAYQQQQQVMPYVAALEAKVQQLESKWGEQERATYEYETQRLNQQIDDFAKDKPYFDEVRPMMATLLQGGQAQDLDTAYDMAVNASPSTRERLREEVRKAEEGKRKAEQKSKAEQARKSTAVNVKSGPSGTASNPKTIDDTLELAWRQATA